ncbi:Putative uncharacterized protein [Lactobacillus equicursoris DSM 19284 = JCM 14600 = CIP 110162]|uniref:Uncharacterized protein n=1 Tax=Lactobacillus equicursoris DSM 19284 = JCM 14600 = CIP 110162 TaxID=1293597 RepID=K0NRM7_9LACO|nr:hypothetical protein [Lactobacillus equicursoris]KRL02571.1 hypothetical protein FC20_GL000254 [Lactobacillus equicursoris DSM 19284 = JCM 14600 = CIP 110162]CCK84719.1 Putative uncharacterized protein [Lactobacillus equicursoris DSM 19284 = JCM 14600 = CIP 110162]
MKFKKIVACILAFLAFGTVFTDTTVSVAQAAEDTSLNQQSNNDTQVFQIPTNGINVVSDGSLNESKLAVGKSAKFVIKKVLKNKNLLIKAVDKIAGRSAAVKVGHFLNIITPTFRKLLKWESLPFATVESQVARALISSGVKSSTARTLAFWIRQALEFVV